MPPYLDCKAKSTTIWNFQNRRWRYYIFDGLSGDGKSIKIKSVEDHISKAYKDRDNDG